MRILSVIIPNKNGEDLLRRFLPQNLQRLQYEAKKIGFRLEVLVIDGDSSDRSREAVNELGAGHCQFISFSGLPSYGAQLNHGVGIATGHFVLILTTDIEIGEGFIEPMINEMESSSDIFSVSPRIQRPLEGGGSGVTYTWTIQKK